MEQYSQEITQWDKTHRLVGKTPALDLVKQSVLALEGLDSEFVSRETLFVDVGAGSGLLGVAALNLFPELRVLFVEPDSKKTAFLRNHLYISHKKLGARSLVASQNLQIVSRETATKLGPLTPMLFARAFSGDTSLVEAAKQSIFAGHHLFTFRSDGPRHFFEKLC